MINLIMVDWAHEVLRAFIRALVPFGSGLLCFVILLFSFFFAFLTLTIDRNSHPPYSTYGLQKTSFHLLEPMKAHLGSNSAMEVESKLHEVTGCSKLSSTFTADVSNASLFKRYPIPAVAHHLKRSDRSIRKQQPCPSAATSLFRNLTRPIILKITCLQERLQIRCRKRSGSYNSINN